MSYTALMIWLLANIYRHQPLPTIYVDSKGNARIGEW